MFVVQKIALSHEVTLNLELTYISLTRHTSLVISVHLEILHVRHSAVVVVFYTLSLICTGVRHSPLTTVGNQN
jgi:hypothetical protein